MNPTAGPRYEQEIPDVIQAFTAAQTAINAHGIPPLLRHLVLLRASQINRCGYCVQMHTREARQDGETSERLDRVTVWDQVKDFSEAEKAALAWTEALTMLGHHSDLGALRARLRDHFSEEQVASLSAMIAMINLWNRFAISRH